MEISKVNNNKMNKAYNKTVCSKIDHYISWPYKLLLPVQGILYQVGYWLWQSKAKI